MRLLIKFPTRGRPEQFAKCFRAWLELRSESHELHFQFDLDEDDPTILEAAQNIQEVARLFPSNTGSLSLWTWSGGPRSKVQAINYKLPAKLTEHDVLILAADDMWPEVQGWDDIIARKMLLHFPDFDGVLHFNDGFRRRHLNTLPIMGRTYYDRFGYIYHPSYRSAYCDNEMQCVSEALGKAAYIDTCIIRHRHPLTMPGTVLVDDTYLKGSHIADVTADRANFVRRQRFAGGSWARRKHVPPGEPISYPELTLIGFRRAPFTTPASMYYNSAVPAESTLSTGHILPLADAASATLSILIASSTKRSNQYHNLLLELTRQRMMLGNPTAIEIIGWPDDGKAPLHEKRNALLASAHGDYVCFVDDDDWVAEDYLWSLLIAAQEGSDCIVFDGQLYIDGSEERRLLFDLKYEKFCAVNVNGRDFGTRPPNHLCPIKTSIAREVGFLKESPGEDVAFALEVRARLKSQSKCVDQFGRNKVLYHYYYSPRHTLTQQRSTAGGYALPRLSS